MVSYSVFLSLIINESDLIFMTAALNLFFIPYIGSFFAAASLFAVSFSCFSKAA